MDRDAPRTGLIQQAQGHLRLGALAHLRRHMGPLAASPIADPGVRQVELGTEGPVERATAGRVISQVFGADDHLAVAALAQRPPILRGHPNGGRSFLGQARVVEHQHASGWRMRRQLLLHACRIQGQRISGRIGQQMVQALGGGAGHGSGDGVGRLVRQIGQQPGERALHTVAAGMPAKQGSKGSEKRLQFR
jgi:hypothetical protein